MSELLRVGVVCYPSYGGSGVVATELALGLARRGHEVHIFSTAPPARFRQREMNTYFHRVSVPHYPLFEHAPYTLALASKIADVAREAKLQLVHTHYAVPHAVAGYLAAQILGDSAPKLVVTLHGTDVTPVGSDPSIRPVLRLALARADALTVPSSHLRSALLGSFELPPSPGVEVIPNFVDTARFRPAIEREPLSPLATRVTDDALPLLIHISNFRPLKRVLDVVEIFARVCARSDARLLMVGDGPERERAEQRLRDLGLSERAYFAGNRGDVADLLRCSDLMLLPSEIESFGLAALEALSCGVPVVAARVGGLEELVEHGTTGFLAPSGDIEAMAEHAVELLGNPERARAMRTAARESAESRWRAETIIALYEACYRRTLKRTA